jgi:hypothetical protein
MIRIIDLDMKAGTDSRTLQLKSPFAKGGFRGISRGYKIPPNPPLKKGGKISFFRITLIVKYFTGSALE